MDIAESIDLILNGGLKERVIRIRRKMAKKGNYQKLKSPEVLIAREDKAKILHLQMWSKEQVRNIDEPVLNKSVLEEGEVMVCVRENAEEILWWSIRSISRYS